MVVAAHRVAMVTLALSSAAFLPTIRISTIPQPHLLLMSLNVAKCNLGEVKIEAMRAAVFVMAAQACCGAAR